MNHRLIGYFKHFFQDVFWCRDLASKHHDVEYADQSDSDSYIGITQEKVSSGDQVDVVLKGGPGTRKAVASEALAVGATLYAADDGKVADTASGNAIGTAMDEVRKEGFDNGFICGFLVCVILLIVFFSIYAGTCHASQVPEPVIDLHRIMMIESSGNPLAHNKRDDSRGLFQITPICLKEYNNFHPKSKYSMNDLWDPDVSRRIADWYLNVRIPKMIEYYGKPVTVRNIIIAYNAGISYVAKNKPLPRITESYLRKYFR
jgi:hypothetical protein